MLRKARTGHRPDRHVTRRNGLRACPPGCRGWTFDFIQEGPGERRGKLALAQDDGRLGAVALALQQIRKQAGCFRGMAEPLTRGQYLARLPRLAGREAIECTLVGFQQGTGGR